MKVTLLISWIQYFDYTQKYGLIYLISLQLVSVFNATLPDRIAARDWYID